MRFKMFALFAFHTAPPVCNQLNSVQVLTLQLPLHSDKLGRQHCVLQHSRAVVCVMLCPSNVTTGCFTSAETGKVLLLRIPAFLLLCKAEAQRSSVHSSGCVGAWHIKVTYKAGTAGVQSHACGCSVHSWHPFAEPRCTVYVVSLHCIITFILPV